MTFNDEIRNAVVKLSPSVIVKNKTTIMSNPRIMAQLQARELGALFNDYTNGGPGETSGEDILAIKEEVEKNPTNVSGNRFLSSQRVKEQLPTV